VQRPLAIFMTQSIGHVLFQSRLGTLGGCFWQLVSSFPFRKFLLNLFIIKEMNRAFSENSKLVSHCGEGFSITLRLGFDAWHSCLSTTNSETLTNGGIS
jgi:hypothetical protein